MYGIFHALSPAARCGIYSGTKSGSRDGSRTPLLCFGPVSVLPGYQGKGIGSALILASFEKAKELGNKASRDVFRALANMACD